MIWETLLRSLGVAAVAASIHAAMALGRNISWQRAVRATGNAVVQRWAAPRRTADITMRRLWNLDATRLLTVAEFPLGIKFAKQGLIVYDQAYRRLIILDGANGRVRFSVGRRGSGPGEFTGKPVAPSGTWHAPFAVEFGTGRVNALVGQTLRKIDVSQDQWTGSGCAFGQRGLLLNRGRLGAIDFWVVAPGPQGKIIDSVAYPWARPLSPCVLSTAEIVDASTIEIDANVTQERACVVCKSVKSFSLPNATTNTW